MGEDAGSWYLPFLLSWVTTFHCINTIVFVYKGKEEHWETILSTKLLKGPEHKPQGSGLSPQRRHADPLLSQTEHLVALVGVGGIQKA